MIEEKQTFDTNCFITETWTSTCAKTLTFCLVKTWFVLDLWFHCFCFSLLHSYIWLPRLFINFDAYLCYGLKDFCPPEFKCWNLGHKMISGSGGVFGKWWGHKGRALVNGTQNLENKVNKSFLSLPPCEITVKRKLCRSRVLTGSCCNYDSVLPASRTVKSECLLSRTSQPCDVL